MMKKKKHSRSQSSTEKNPKKTLEPSSDSSPSPRLLSLLRSKLASGQDLKHMLRGMRSKTAPGLSSQSRIVRCPKCHKLLQEPIDATIYKCSGCDSILQATRWEVEGNDNSIPEALFSSQNHSLSSEVESAEGGNKTPTHREYNSRESPSVERGYHSETVYKHETSDIRREWMRRADEFRVTGDSDVFASARSSPYNSRRNASEWTQHEGKYKEPPRVPFYPPSPSPSSAYDYGYSSPQVSASEKSYYHHQPNQFKQYGREDWFQESSPISFPGDGKYYHRSSQSQLHDLQHHNNIYESSSSATPHRSVYSERSYQADTAPRGSMGISTSETSSEKSSLRDNKKYVRKRNPVVKRYVLPSAGGAPFATCSYCLELLQLPQVSLHGKHKRYQVRCGSCSGVLKFSIREKADIVLDSGMGFADETLQDSASEGHEEIYPDDSHLSSSDNGYGDRICKSTDSVMLKQNLETFEDKGMIKEDIRSISSKFLDSKLEALQPSLNHKLREQQPASSETIGETLRIHLEEAHSEKSTEMDNNILERVGCDLEESGYEKNEPQEMFGDGSGESLEVPVYKNEKMSDSSIEAETAADRQVSHSVEPLNNNEYVSETCLLSENTQEFDWEETQENKEYGGERKWEDIMRDKPGLPLEQSRYIGDSICDSGSSNVKEDTKQISNTFSDAMPQYPLNSLVKESFIGNPDQSCKATVTTSSIHEEQSKYEYENLSERRELDKTISDRVSYELEESRYETNETLEPGKVSECGSVVSLKKASETFKTSIEGETGEEGSVSHQMDSPNEFVENPNDRLEPVCLEGSGYAGERTWAETMGDRAGLHLEEYESNYENYSKPLEWTSERAPTFHMHEYELGTIRGPEEDADGRSESSSRGSFTFSDHESSEESVRTQAAKPDQSQYEYENSSERQGLSNTVFDISECRYETNETFEPGKLVGVGSVVSLEKASETIIGETGKERSVSHQMAPQNDNVEISYRTIEPVYLEGSGYASERTWAETMGDEAGLQLKEYQNNPHEWTTERPPTFRLHEYELGTIPEPEDDANGRSISSSTDFFNDHESLKERVVAHEEEPWLVDENKTEELKVGVMVEDGPVLHLEKCGNDSKKLEKTFEWTERTPTFHLHESELGTMPEPNEDADGRSESSSTGSFNNHESSKVRAVVHEEETQLVNDSRTGNLQVCKMTEDRVSLDLEKGENESMKLEETFEWTSERAPTFRLQEYELGTMLEPNEEADGRSESSSRGSFNDHEISKEREINQKEQHRLVIDSRIEALQLGEMAKDTVSLHFEECENESMKLDETLEWTSGRALTFRRRDYELGTMLKLEETFEWTERTPTFHLHESELGTMPEPNEDADGRSESSSTGSFNNHESSKVRAVVHEEETQLVNDSRTGNLQVCKMTEDRVSLDLEKGENESMKLEETFEWTSERAPTFRLQEYELGTMLEPNEEADGRSESSSRGSFNDHEISKEREINQKEQHRLVIDSRIEALQLGEMAKDTVSLHFEECENESMKLDETLEWTSGRALTFRRRDYELGTMLKLEETFEWTERTPTFHLHESELGTMPEPNEDADGRSESSSTGSFNNHESSKVRAVVHEEETQRVNDSRTGNLQVCKMTEDRVSLDLEKGENESMKLEETFEWTSERAPTFRLQEYELGTMLEPNEEADGRSESSSRGSFNDHEISKEREINQKEQHRLVIDSRIEALQLGEMAKDTVSLHFEECENESMKLDETLEWTSGRALTFRRRDYELGTMLKLEETFEWTERTPTFHLHESELGTMPEPNEDADGRSESSSTGSFNNHESSKVRAVLHEEEPQLVNDSRTEHLQVREMTEDKVSLDLEKGENQSMKLDETFEWTSGRALTFLRGEYELGTMLNPDEDADGRSESSLRGSFNDRGSSKERAVIHEDEPWLVDDYETKALKADVMVEDGPSLHLEKCENEKMELDQTLEPRDDMFRLSLDDTLEQERMTFHLEMSQNKQENLRQTFKQGDAKEDIPEFGSRVSSEGHESPSKMAEVDNEAEEDILADHLEYLQKEKEKSGLTSELYAHFYNTTEPSEIVGLRHALYQTQTSPLRSPLSSPIHTPISSPLHYLMESQMRSPIASPMHSHIVSPLRSPINTSGSLSDVLFYGKKV